MAIGGVDGRQQTQIGDLEVTLMPPIRIITFAMSGDNA
jgi:hypothetical protein